MGLTVWRCLVKRVNRGFTLLEVMIALSIFGVTASVIALVNTQALSSARLIEEQIQARWVAENYLTELRLSNRLPDEGIARETITFNNRSWIVEREVNLVEIEVLGPKLRNIQLMTYLEGESEPADTLTAVLAEP